MSEIVSVWLTNLYENEILDIEGAIDNERCFLRGTADADEMLMHQENIREYQGYLVTLHELLDGLTS